MSRDIVTHFVNFAPIKYKTVHESYIVINNIPWWNIDFNHETKLLKDFKQYVFRKGKKKDKKAVKDIDALVDNHLTKIEEYKLKSPEEYKLKSPEYHPQSLSIQSQMTE
ncbi:1653_t:CDS:2 [Gigaspora rosea]|nr:1653_t:CDS:2 [Gigaspora rosea]